MLVIKSSRNITAFFQNNFLFSSLKSFNNNNHNNIFNQLINTSSNNFKHENDNIDKSLKKEFSPGEKKLVDLLRGRFPNAKTIEVNDISGGCGSMYEIFVETNEFKNTRKVKQHQMINEVLQTEIKNNMHGLRIYTAIPES